MARVLVLCGGDNQERRVSLGSGDAVARGLIAAGHDVIKIDTAAPETVVPGDTPLLDGAVGPTPPNEAENARLDRAGWTVLMKTLAGIEVDAVLPILHGSWGEDGHIQAMLDLLGLPYLGSSMLASALSMDKQSALLIAEGAGVNVPGGLYLQENDHLDEAFTYCEEEIGMPVVIKPNRGGSTVGLAITSDHDEFVLAIQSIHKSGDAALVEKYIDGRELTVTILDGEPYPLVEIVPKTGLYDYTRKYTKGETQYICPAPVDDEIAEEAKKLSRIVYWELGCRHLARVDWRLAGSGELYFLEVNTIPGMTDLSLVPMAAKAEGLDFPALMDKFVQMTLRDAGKK